MTTRYEALRQRPALNRSVTLSDLSRHTRSGPATSGAATPESRGVVYKDLLVVSDVDDTIHDTTLGFTPRLLDFIHEAFGIAPDRFRHLMCRYRDELSQAKGPHHEGYDLFDHLAALGYASRAAELALSDFLRGEDFLFPEVGKLLDYHQADPNTDVVLKTVGGKRTQRFKIQRSRRLDGIPYEVFDRNKGVVLAERWKDGVIRDGNTVYQRAVFLEDKPGTLVPMLHLPPSVRLVQVVRPGGCAPTTATERVEVVNNLLETL